MQRIVIDRYLPPDHAAFVAAEPPTGRLIVIAPTRAACETIEIALGLHIPTLLEKQHGREIRDLAGAGKGFGIVAGTGTGKTLSIRPIAETILRTDSLKAGVVNREREATPETPSWSVIAVTTGIARRWFRTVTSFPPTRWWSTRSIRHQRSWSSVSPLGREWVAVLSRSPR